MAIAPLSHDEQRACVRLWQEKQDYSARDKLVRSYVRLAMQFVRQHKKITIDDGMQNALLRITQCLDTFDLESPYTVGTYIRHWIIRGIHETYVQCATGGTAKAADITKANKRKRRENELMANGMSEMRAAQTAYSELPESQKNTAQYAVNSEKAVLSTEAIEYTERDIYIHHVKRYDDRRIIQLNLGLIGLRRWTFEKLGRVMRKSRQAVYQDYQRGVKQIRGALLKAHAKGRGVSSTHCRGSSIGDGAAPHKI